MNNEKKNWRVKFNVVENTSQSSSWDNVVFVYKLYIKILYNIITKRKSRATHLSLIVWIIHNNEGNKTS